MDLDKRTEANRENAKCSTGPKTPEGKAAASHNAVKHGLLARIPVLPLVESQVEWDGHCEQLESHLAPAGLLETVLVEKVALQLWRLKRLALYEREVTAISLESVKETQREDDDENDDDSPAYGTVRPVAAAKQAVKRLETELGAVVSLGGRGENEAVDSGLAARLIEDVAEDLDVDIYDDNEIDFPDYPDGADLDSIEWTAGYLKTCLGEICQHGGSNFDTALAKRIAKYRVDLAKAKGQVRSLMIEVGVIRGLFGTLKIT